MYERQTPDGGTLPDFITSPSETWAAAVAPTREQALAIFRQYHYATEPDELIEVRLARAPVPDEYADEFAEWFEVNPQGRIVAWEVRF